MQIYHQRQVVDVGGQDWRITNSLLYIVGLILCGVKIRLLGFDHQFILERPTNMVKLAITQLISTSYDKYEALD